MSRRIIIAANWKMHHTVKETKAFISKLQASLKNSNTLVYIAPPFTSISAAKHEVKKTSICIGAQNMSPFPKGAYTGEISSEMLKEAGAVFVILGHSERRHLFGEDHQIIRDKLLWALKENFEAILCIGETEEEREKGQIKEVLTKQLLDALQDFPSHKIEKLIIAYEPVWAIGTGKTATPEIVDQTHKFCRDILIKCFGEKEGDAIPILYGGSVKVENISAFIEQVNIDGALIGGASLDVNSFATIIHRVEEKLR